MAEIKDSGNRTTFDTGAVRDIQEGKGRCDLMPLDIVSDLMQSQFLFYIDWAKESKVICESRLFAACIALANEWYHEENSNEAIPNLLLEVAVHFEEGAKKYGENNWQKGIPIKRYMDSAIRHYLKYRGGWTDERHDRAAMWNVVCALWTLRHHPELNDYSCDAPMPEKEEPNDYPCFNIDFNKPFEEFAKYMNSFFKENK